MLTAVKSGCALASAVLLATVPAIADVVADCNSPSPERAISGCSIVIEGGSSIGMDLATAYVARGNASEAEGDHDRVIADLTKAIEMSPAMAGAYSNRANIYYRLGQLDTALADYNEAIRLNLNFAGAYYNRGNLLSQKGDLAGALTDLTAALHLEPTYASGCFNQGILY